jgi:uncharacterized OB-fold protein
MRSTPAKEGDLSAMANTGTTKRRPIREDLFTMPFTSLEEVRLMGGRCRKCEEVSLGKRLYCPNCGNPDIQDLPLSKKGKLWTYTIIRHRPPGDYKGADPFVPFCLGLVALPEGIRVVSPIEADIDLIKIGMDLELSVYRLYVDGDGNEVIAFKFKPV